MINDKEHWKTIEEFQNYEVSNLGRIRNSKTGLIKNPKPNNKTGHLATYLCKDGKVYTRWVHRIVAKAFVENPNGLPIVMHIDDNPKNNAASNLRWGTQKENMTWNDVQVVMSKAHGGRPVQQIDKDGNVVAVYQTVMEASRKVGISHTCIFMCLRKARKTAGGFAWKRV